MDQKTKHCESMCMDQGIIPWYCPNVCSVQLAATPGGAKPGPKVGDFGSPYMPMPDAPRGK